MGGIGEIPALLLYMLQLSLIVGVQILLDLDPFPRGFNRRLNSGAGYSH